MTARKLAVEEEEDREENEVDNDSNLAWESLLRRMLPPGAPLPDDEHLDYSIAVEYDGPSPTFTVPKVNPLPVCSTPARRLPPSSATSPKVKATASNHQHNHNGSAAEQRALDSDPDSAIAGESVTGSQDHLTLRAENGKGNEISDLNSSSMIRSSSLTASASQVDGGIEVEEGQGADSAVVMTRGSGPQDSPNLNLTGASTQLACPDSPAMEDNPPEAVQTLIAEERAQIDRERDEDAQSYLSSSSLGAASSPARAFEKVHRKRGPCSRCGKGNRFSDRELCIVCGARYCANCVLKAMGSMPEGRKCINCNGQPIHESKRATLGKSSRVLSKVCSTLEVKQIMKAEKECYANQLRPEQLVVNGRQLMQEELAELFTCSLRPQNLKPGRYWYDKDSGLWGKEGQKPDTIITSRLNIGGKLKMDASNGNTKVYINGREITKPELQVLKVAKVQCPQDTHFWVYEDGSYEEEGQNNIKGNIWAKASTRLVCSLLKLPFRPLSSHGQAEDPSSGPGRSAHQHEYLDHTVVQKLLLLGLKGSGTGTIFKQVKFLYGNKFNVEELESIKLMIQSNLYKYLGILLEGREGFEEEALMNRDSVADVGAGEAGADGKHRCTYSLTERLKKHADWLLEIMANGDMDAFFPAAAREYAPLVEELWKDPAIQETYKRKEELHFLPDVAKYFLDRAVEISSHDYEPSENDILYAEGLTQSNGLSSVEFSLDDSSSTLDVYDDDIEYPSHFTKYQLIHINSSGLQDGYKWLGMFEDTRALVFCVALSDYDQMWGRGTGPLYNKMLVSKEMFENVARHPSFRDAPAVLLLTKYDEFEGKISKVPLTVCEWFREFHPLIPHSTNQSLAQHAYIYVAVKFKQLFASISGQKLYVWQTKGRERASVDEAFKYIREVLKWDEERDRFIGGNVEDDSPYNTETTFDPYPRQ